MRSREMSHAPQRRGWLDLLDALYADSWNPALHRFRSRFAYRGVSIASGTLSSSLARLAGGSREIGQIELGLLRSFRRYAQEHSRAGESVSAHAEAFDADGEVWCVDFAPVNARLPKQLRRLFEDEQSEGFTVDMLAGFRRRWCRRHRASPAVATVPRHAMSGSRIFHTMTPRLAPTIGPRGPLVSAGPPSGGAAPRDQVRVAPRRPPSPVLDMCSCARATSRPSPAGR